jgi:hypothetical protein
LHTRKGQEDDGNNFVNIDYIFYCLWNDFLGSFNFDVFLYCFTRRSITMEKKELSPLAKQLLSGAGAVEMFTQSEFDDALAVAKAEIMMVAIETTKRAILIERDECAKIVEDWSDGINDPRDEGKKLAELIRNRIPSQRQ